MLTLAAYCIRCSCGSLLALVERLYQPPFATVDRFVYVLEPLLFHPVPEVQLVLSTFFWHDGAWELAAPQAATPGDALRIYPECAEGSKSRRRRLANSR